MNNCVIISAQLFLSGAYAAHIISPTRKVHSYRCHFYGSQYSLFIVEVLILWCYLLFLCQTTLDEIKTNPSSHTKCMVCELLLYSHNIVGAVIKCTFSPSGFENVYLGSRLVLLRPADGIQMMYPSCINRIVYSRSKSRFFLSIKSILMCLVGTIFVFLYERMSLISIVRNWFCRFFDIFYVDQSFETMESNNTCKRYGRISQVYRPPFQADRCDIK